MEHVLGLIGLLLFLISGWFWNDKALSFIKYTSIVLTPVSLAYFTYDGITRQIWLTFDNRGFLLLVSLFPISIVIFFWYQFEWSLFNKRIGKTMGMEKPPSLRLNRFTFLCVFSIWLIFFVEVLGLFK